MTRYVFFSLFLLIFTQAYSQNSGSIRGQVIDAEMQDEPMLFANVKLKETEKNVQTNFHGNFEITEIEAGEYTLVISFPGYETQEVDVLVRANQVTDIQQDMFARRIDVNAILSSEATLSQNDESLSTQPKK